MLRHEADFNLMCLYPLELPIKRPTSLTFNRPATPNRARKPTILIFCNSGKTVSMISEAFYVDLVKHLCKENRFRIILAYGDISVFDTLPSLRHKCLSNVTDALDLPDLIDLIRSVDIYVGPDTGPTHIASALNKKTVVLYKSYENPPLRWGPFCDVFRLVRYDYLHDYSYRERTERTAICAAIDGVLEQTDAFSDHEKHVHHERATLRFIWLSNSKAQLLYERNRIRALREDGWIVTPVIKRRNPINTVRKLYRTFRKRHINACFFPYYSWYFLMFDWILYKELFPKLVVRSKY